MHIAKDRILNCCKKCNNSKYVQNLHILGHDDSDIYETFSFCLYLVVYFNLNSSYLLPTVD